MEPLHASPELAKAIRNSEFVVLELFKNAATVASFDEYGDLRIEEYERRCFPPEPELWGVPRDEGSSVFIRSPDAVARLQAFLNHRNEGG